ncbi:MAG: hypothetical protein ABI769_00220 [Pseudomonadota bacterium]
MFKLFAPALLALVPLTAQAQQMDMAAMQKWGAADVVKYHIVGEYQNATSIASDGAGQADVSDRVVIDLVWKLSEAKLAGAAVFQNFKSTAVKLRDREPSCLAPVLKGDYEHYDLLSVKDGLGGALEFLVTTTYPVVEVAQMCTGSRKPVPAKVKTRPEDFSLPSPVMFGMGIPNTPELSVTPDKKSFIVKKKGWTWTITPSLK